MINARTIFARQYDIINTVLNKSKLYLKKINFIENTKKDKF